ncbi:MAG: PEP-CTERM system TPR-repeat protein PrsT [Sphingomonadales bacterium]
MNGTWRSRIKSTVAAICLAQVGLLWAAAPAWAVDIAESQTHYERALKAFEAEEFRTAQIELRNALKANPDNADARMLLARIYLKAGQGIAAQTEIEAARRVGVAIDDSRIDMARALLFQQEYQRALTELDLARVPVGQRSEALELSGLAYLGLGDDPKALETLLQAREADPNNVNAHIALSRYYAGKNQRADALASIDQALALDPDHAGALVLKGDLTRNIEGLEAALPYFDRAIESQPENLAARLERAATLVDMQRDDEAKREIDFVYKRMPEHPLAHYLSAVLLARKGDYAGASELMDQTKGALDGYLPATQFRGIIAYQLGRFEQAQSLLQRVVTAVPRSFMARRIYGATLMRLGNPQGALDALQPMIDEGEKDSGLLALYGMALVQIGDFQQAMTYFENAVAAAPDRAALRTQLAVSQMALGDPQSASRELEAVLKMDPDSLQAMVMLSLIDLKAGEFDKALATATKLAEKYKDQPIADNLIGTAHLGKGDVGQAERYFKLALEKNPDYHEARRNLAQLYRAAGQLDESRRQYVRVLEGDPDNVQSMLALADLARLQGQPEVMVDWLGKAVRVDPEALEPRLQLIAAFLGLGNQNRALTEAASLGREFPDNASAVEAVGRTYALAEDYDEAIFHFNRLITLVPENPGARRLLAQAQWRSGDVEAARATLRRALSLEGNLGDILLDLVNLEQEQGNFETALGYAGQLRQQFPNMNVADAAIGRVQMGARNWAAAAEAYERARATESNKGIVIGLYQAYSNLGAHDKAVNVLEDWLATDPNDVTVQLALAGSHLSAKNYDRALEIYEQLQGAGEENPAVLNNMAFIYQKKGDSRMVATAAKAYELNRDSPYIADTYGWILVKNGNDPARGLQLIQQAADKLVDVPDVRYHLAYALNANGRRAAALRELEDLLADDPEFDEVPDARALLAQLKADQ